MTPARVELEEAALREQMGAAAGRRAAALDQTQKLCTQMVSVRTALYSIILVLNQVRCVVGDAMTMP